ncbi:MAG: tRNA uridine-5-carboxymethylaminomethyl(34) synthesis GTPase MnmE [candidate division KSB1 bacterium]|jgi:tRNA modification GTPase|nr:tRNA uridine-5-carboxymethylaminomethyl(34) synthesis GTPase MnmE [candidate division KSB1 bacterium]
MSTGDGEDTIAAISTPVGIGGISIIRMSGDASIDILKKVFKDESDKGEYKSWRPYYGSIRDGDVTLDHVLVTIFREPKSYTAEDMVEVSCHGGMYVSRRILELLIRHGARPADPGEFTKRAFLNGRIDLSQAEAVADLIEARTEAGLQASLQQLDGKLYENVAGLRNELISLCSMMELELDFSEENIQITDAEDISARIAAVLTTIVNMISSYDRGKIIKEGIKLVIVGRPNVGKSSLLNALLKEDRAIVTSIPGTTRDFLEEQLDISGILFRAVDTAGIAESGDIVEIEGISRTRRHTETADLILHVLDASQPLTKDDHEIAERMIERWKKRDTSIVCVINKIDLDEKIDIDSIAYGEMNIPPVRISAKNMTGITDLEKAVTEAVFKDRGIVKSQTDEVVISRSRHLHALRRAQDALEDALLGIKDSMSSEFIVVDLRSAMESLGEIIGEVTSEDILNHIFDNFCIGK